MTTPSEETEQAEENQAVVSIDRSAFCDRIDPALVERALGAPPQWLVQRKPGDTYELIPGKKEKETRFYCRWQTSKESQTPGPDDAVFIVTIHGKPATTAVVDTRLAESKENHEATGKQWGCEETETTFGDRSFAQACNFKGDQFNDPSSSVSMIGAFGDALASCFAQRNGPNEAAQVPDLLDVCTQVPSGLGS